MKKLTLCAVCALAVCACTPVQVADVASTLGVDIGPETATLVAAHYDHPADCNAAIERVWPQSLKSWARKVAWRESTNNPRAQNRHSTAAGCFGILRMHADLFRLLGYSWADRYDALANTRVAWALYQGSGSNPWRATR